MSTSATLQRCEQLQWQPSPGGQVERKRYRLIGETESGMVTSLVRYAPGACFPAHPHPDGEEIIVLEGVFSDHSGDYAAGSHLLNPQGFRHAPWSGTGCLLFVKLRQYPGTQNSRQLLNTERLHWHESAPGVEKLGLHQNRDGQQTRWLERCQPGQTSTARIWPNGAEIFVVDGGWRDDQMQMSRHDWALLPAGYSHQLTTTTGCTLYICTTAPELS